MGQIQTLDELIGLLIRRRLLIGAICVFGVVMTLLYAISKPDVFEATAVIQVQSPNLPDQSATAAQNTGQSAQRLQSIEQRLTTRENMLAVIERHGLYADLPLSDDEKVHLLRISLRFQTVASAASPAYGAPTQVSALLILAQADTRAKAARVANDFAQGILDAGAEGQTTRARETAAFYRDEESRLLAEIAKIDAEITAFKAQNGDALPSSSDLYRDTITALDLRLRDLDQALVTAQSEQSIIRNKQVLRATDQRQLDVLATQIVTLGVQRDALTDQRSQALAALAKIPEIERVLAEHERSQDQLQSQLDVVAQRKAEADTAQKLEDRQQGENFTLLERAVEPNYPISGGRKRLAIVGAMASLIAGVGIAFVMDLLFPALRTRTQLERQLNLRAIVAIPELSTLKPATQARSLPRLTALADLRPGAIALPLGIPYQGSQNLPFMQRVLGGAAVILLILIAVALT